MFKSLLDATYRVIIHLTTAEADADKSNIDDYT